MVLNVISKKKKGINIETKSEDINEEKVFSSGEQQITENKVKEEKAKDPKIESKKEEKKKEDPKKKK